MYAIIEGSSKVRDAFDWEISGADLFFLGMTGIVYFILIFVVEYLKRIPKFARCLKREHNVPYIPKKYDSDV